MHPSITTFGCRPFHLMCVLVIMEVWVQPTESDSDVVLPPVITSEPDDEYVVVLGQSFTLPCVATGYPLPTYHWLQDGVPYIPGPHVSMAPMVGSLEITLMSEEDEGSFECWAENSGGKTRTNPSNVRLAFLNQFSHQTPSVLSVYIGTSSRLTCDPPEGLPSPTLTWEVGVSDQHQSRTPLVATVRIMQSLEGHLYITNITPEDEEVTFYCKAVNDVMRSIVNGPSYTIRTKTDPRLDVMAAATVWWTSPSWLTVTAGDDAKLQCIFDGSPTPTVIWERNDAPLPVGRWFTLEGGTLLEIRGAREEDTGTYTCVGYNDVTTDHVFYEVTLKVTPRAPSLVTTPQSQNVTEGSHVSFSCRASDIPEPEYMWYINGTQPSKQYLEDHTKLTAHSLSIPVVDWTDTMSITCGVSTSYGTTNGSAYLSVQRAAFPAVFGQGVRKNPHHVIYFFVFAVLLLL